MPTLTLPAPARILSVRQDNYRTKTFVLDARLQATPGQFVMAWLPRFDEKPFSLVDTDPVRLMVTAVGPFTRLVHELAARDSLWLRGPFGSGFHVAASQRRIALVGGGYGVAPLFWLARQQLDRAAHVHVFLGARTAGDILYADDLGHLAASSSTLITHVTTEDGSLGRRGLVTDALEPLLADGAVDGLYACGPHGMLAALERLARDYKVPCQLSWEAYMRCAVGICGACEHEGKVLCMDGPVLIVNCEL